MATSESLRDGNQLLDQGRVDEALNCYIQFLTQGEIVEGLHLGIGLCLLRQSRIPEGIEYLLTERALYPGNAQARQVLLQLDAVLPQTNTSRLRCAVLELADQKPEKCLNDIEALESEKVSLPGMLVAKAWALIALNRTDQAKVVLHQALQREPRLYEAQKLVALLGARS